MTVVRQEAVYFYCTRLATYHWLKLAIFAMREYMFQVLGKSIKPIPVMILGVLLAKKRYPLLKYLFVLMIVIGVALFTFKDKKVKTKDDDHTFGYGGLLLVSMMAERFFPFHKQCTTISLYKFCVHKDVINRGPQFLYKVLFNKMSYTMDRSLSIKR